MDLDQTCQLHKCLSLSYLQMISTCSTVIVIVDLVRLTNIELEKLRVWFAVKRLSLNISKTYYIFFW